VKRKIFRTVLILFLVAVGFTGCAKTQENASIEPSLPPELLLDSDGDGFNDWFEVNIAGYDPTVPNDRYIILYFHEPDRPGLEPSVIDQPANFFIQKGKVPPENIITLSQEGANHVSLERAISQIANKSDKNDIVFLSLHAHGSPGSILGAVHYVELNKWLDRIEAKAVIVAIGACFSETALPIMKEGTSPRIVYAQTGGEFIGTLGARPEFFKLADTRYGNNDGFVSVGEVENYLSNHVPPAPKPTWGYIKGVDLSNIASQIYLTDYTPTE